MKRYLIYVTERVGSTPEAMAKAKKMFPHLKISPMTAIKEGLIQVLAEADAEACERAKKLMPRALESSEFSTAILEASEVSEPRARGLWI